ncbi:glucose-fructose oxidoreductase [Puia dinghuensis]|uniref:Glucose-fructose oxidoreductase n=1 Tax=Puia dinghuensis TaxID=1792502 RepID=A0A8J2UH47_9BACT|nr:glucose-fructose oxidoreductase [Puia dinghuensis]
MGVAGLTHDHVHNIMHQYKRGEVIIAGIAEADAQLIARYKKSYQLPDSLFYNNLSDLITHTHPDAVLAYNAISEHLGVVETCAPKGISVMVEKPLATTVKDAERIAALAAQYHIQVLTNYETTWYDTNQQIFEMVNSNIIGVTRKMIVHDGHQGPKEIGCSPDFLNWLTDPVKNGGGALRDFGCYGANLMTWLMHGKAPIAVTAVTHHIKPSIYPKVDDDATILLEYPDATGIIEASWNWPYSIKDWEVFGTTGYLHALNDRQLLQRVKNTYDSVAVHPAVYRDNIAYLSSVLSGKTDPGNDLSSLANNLIVVRILDAATRSSKEGRRIELH